MRYDLDRNELVVESRRFPVAKYRHDDLKILGLSHILRNRQALLFFENMWELSVIWGNYTHSSNFILHYKGAFIEDPDSFEVGIFSPGGKIVEGTVYDGIGGEPTVVPDHFTRLWIDPLGYVTDQEFLQLVTLVSGFSSEGLEPPEDCFSVSDLVEYLERIQQ